MASRLISYVLRRGALDASSAAILCFLIWGSVTWLQAFAQGAGQ